MKYQLLVSVFLILLGCSNETTIEIDSKHSDIQNLEVSPDTLSYEEIKFKINKARLSLIKKCHTKEILETDSAMLEIARFWVNMVAGDLFQQWKGTPWDFNGTTTVPRQGNIACGYFVTSVLTDMGVQLNRRQLSTCASSVMMRKLVPGRPLINLSGLSFNRFCDSLEQYALGVFIIGLDYHTGFVVVDSNATWFIHSYYAQNIGVIKEVPALSPALQSSKTKWLVPLTADKGFIRRWMGNVPL